MSKLRQRMIQDMKIRNYSPRTIKVYISRVAKYAQYFGTSPDRLSREHIREYQRYLVEEKECSWSQLNQTVCALRFLYRVCLNQATMVEYIPYAKQPKSLPVVLSRGEVGRLLDAARDVKNRTVLMFLYATGVRISEALALRVSDVDSQRMVIHVRGGKAGKDRYLLLTNSLLEQIRVYWLACARPVSYSWAETHTRRLQPEQCEECAARRPTKRGSPKRLPRIRSATALQPIIWRQVPISKQSRCGWGTVR